MFSKCLFDLSLHKPVRKKFKRRKVVVPGPYHSVQVDLQDWSKKPYPHHIEYRWILVVVDSFSRMAWTRPLKNKTAKETAEALDSIFAEFPWLPKFFVSDKGNEFNPKNKFIKEILIKSIKCSCIT